ncbi:MAG: hypothetical protein QW291_07475 [Thermofilaceae archaeon]
MGLAEDIDEVITRLSSRLDPPLSKRLEILGAKLKELALRHMVSSNHTVMELVIAKHLLERGYEVEVEYELAPNLVCDIFATRNGRTIITEVETGFVPPENSTDPMAYRMARELSKVARYSKHSDEFAMAIPPFHILQLPYVLFLPPEERDRWGIKYFKNLIDAYYSKPPVDFDELMTAKLHYVYVVLVDSLQMIELTAGEYYNFFVERPASLLWRTGWPLSIPPLEED